MDPHAFVAEVYRRMSLRHAAERPRPAWEEMRQSPVVQQAASDCRSLLPHDKEAAILDVGFGDGWFIAACICLGYTNISGADFGIPHKSHVKQWSPGVVALDEIESNIGDFLTQRQARYDFIHMSHVIEHIPKYSLLYIVDALYAALRVGGTLMLRTPNMEGPCANSSLYVTLAHEYGFAGSNLYSLLSICNFDDIRLLSFPTDARSGKQAIGAAMRWPILQWNRFRHRLFGVNYGGIFGTELVVTARRGDRPCLLDERCK